MAESHTRHPPLYRNLWEHNQRYGPMFNALGERLEDRKKFHVSKDKTVAQRVTNIADFNVH